MHPASIPCVHPCGIMRSSTAYSVDARDDMLTCSGGDKGAGAATKESIQLAAEHALRRPCAVLLHAGQSAVGGGNFSSLPLQMIRFMPYGTAAPLAAPGRADGPGTPAQRAREPELEEPEPAAQSTQDQVRAGMAALLEANC